MDKKTFVKEIATKLEVSQKDAERFLMGICEVSTELLNKGEEITFPNIIKLSTKVKEAHEARNPKTSETIQVPEKTVPVVKVCKALKDAVK